MTATWYLVRHVPDLKRREPRNIGLLLNTPEGWFTRFMGEEPSGAINGRKLPHSTINTEVYKTWVDYFRRKAAQDDWDAVERLQRSRRGNYYAELGGHVAHADVAWPIMLERLYAELVDDEAARRKPARESTLDYLTHGVDLVMDAAGLVPQREVQVLAKFETGTTTVPFRYSFVNGQQHLMDVVHHHSKPDQAAADARELRARVDAAMRAGAATSFIAFYASSLLADDLTEDILRPVEKVSNTIDIDDVDDATGKLRSLTTH